MSNWGRELRGRGITLAAALACACALETAVAAEITVLSAAAVQLPAVAEAEAFERATGHRVVFTFATAGGVDERLAAGAQPDIVINASSRIAVIAKRATAEPRLRPLGTVRIGVAARAGAARPDVSSVAAFRTSLLRASSIAYGNPAGGATTGVHFAKVLADLGIADAVAGKAILAANGLEVMRKVASGEAELGITQTSEIMHIAPETFVGLIPEPIQLATTYTAWVRDPANAPARALVDAMAGGDGRARFRTAGFE